MATKKRTFKVTGPFKTFGKTRGETFEAEVGDDGLVRANGSVGRLETLLAGKRIEEVEEKKKKDD